jgi:hypothetical protein
MVVSRDGRPVAVVWNYAIHGTALGRGNALISGDLMGEASARIERALEAPALFVNGAVGDVSPARRGWEGVRSTGEILAAGALGAWARITVEPDARLEVMSQHVTVGPPALRVRNCTGRWLPRWLGVGLGSALPSSSEVVAVAVGRAGWVTIPGELETRLGLEIKAAAPRPLERVFVAGVSNDYLGYFLTAEAYDQPSYIACGSLYGERGGAIVRDAAVALLTQLAARLAGGEPAPPPMRPNGPKRPDRHLKSSRFRREGQRPNGPKRPDRHLKSSTVRRDGQSGRGLLDGVELAGERGLLAGGGVPVKDALGHGPVQCADGLTDDGRGLGGLGPERRRGALDDRTELAAHGAVALAVLLALLHPLDRGLGVGHWSTPPWVLASMWTAGKA